jgi:hypothetical protein
VRRGALALVAVTLLTGCGGASPSLADLRHDADRICTHANRAMAEIAPPASSPGTSAFLAAGVTRMETELRQLRLITPSNDVAPVYRAGLEALSGELTALRAANQAIHRGEDPAIAFKVLQHRLAPLENQATNAWQSLRIPACLSA